VFRVAAKNSGGEAPSERALLHAETERARRAERADRLIILSGQFALIAATLVFWQVASGRLLDPLFFSDPISIARAFLDLAQSGVLWLHLQTTMIEVISGYVIGVVLGVATAAAVAQTPGAEPVARPFVLAAYATPKVALAPLIIIWFGIQLLPKIVLAASLVFFPVYFNTLAGFAAVSPQLLAIVRVMRAGRLALLTKVVLPSAAPYIFAGMRITLPAALIGALIGEFLSSSHGVGYLIAAASSRYDTAQVFAGIFTLLIVVLAMNVLVSLAERHAMRWRGGAPASFARRR
jgi:NitT/TauT family transport system permease protein